MELQLAALVFVVVLGAAVYAISRRASSSGQRRLMGRLARSRAEQSAETMRAAPYRGARHLRFQWLSRFSPMQKLEENLWQAGIHTPASDVLIIMLLVFAAAATAGAALWQEPLISLAVAVGFAVLPVVFVRILRQRRLAAFARQFPSALDLMKSALEAGHTLLRGLQVVVEEFQDPLAAEFRSAIEQSRLGLPLPRAIEEILRRVPDADLRLLVVAIRVQSEVGSSLAQIIGRLAEIVRTRQRLHAQVRALTAQARLGGWIVGLLPVAVLAVFSLVQPSHTRLLFYDPMGVKILKFALIMDGLALLSIHKLLKVKL